MDSTLRFIKEMVPVGVSGTVTSVIGLTLAARHFPVPLGAVCRIDRRIGEPLEAEVVGFRDDNTLLVAFGELRGVRSGDRIELVRSTSSIRVGPGLIGRVVDGLGRFSDGKPASPLPHRVALHADPPSPMDRPRICDPLPTGIRVIDGFLTCAKGQRLGIFAGTGVGKSVTLGMIARFARADVIVVGLVGERGREVREFLEKDLGDKGMQRSVVVNATGDEPALMRLKAAFTATAIAEYFRDQGKDVLLMMDSLTRLAMAQREIGLSAGEPPTTKGYPPSVFAMMPRLLERAGRGPKGSITGLYTVLVEADDMNEIISDTVRGILDGHIWLSRRLAAQAHYPAVDVLESVSRSMPDIISSEHLQTVEQLKRQLALYLENQDLITLGAYQRGANPQLDLAIAMRDPINGFLRQSMNEHSTYDQTQTMLKELVELSKKTGQAPVIAPAAKPVAPAPPPANPIRRS